ncbi:flagellar basal body rod protein [Bacillus lacus]|uniref:Flagellar basal body rod protein n=1 Tax=Metabacillus lacus TaxID=1983721 RepID=A0A7X2LXX6_9BACI|nr:flagellar basal body rod protein [Metabacillus lacus]MRX71183.1 flagellar basal body rod protein [Metabacillus lacus]
MKKFGLFAAGGIAALILLANVGSMLALAVTLVLLYFVFREFMKAKSTSAKVLWGIAGIIIASATLANIPALLGLVAAYVLYLVVKSWRSDGHGKQESGDPFTSFEKEWRNLKQTK